MRFSEHARNAQAEEFPAAPGRLSSEFMLHRIIQFIVGFVVLSTIAVFDPKSTSEPAASPEDRAQEDLSRFEYPSQARIAWRAHFVRPQDSLERLFGNDWVLVARFNRIDRRHVYPGMTIKVPLRMDEIRNYTPMPTLYEPARRYPKYIYLSVAEQWLGAYEYGRLVFSMPAATGVEGHLAPTGIFKAEAYHRRHTSSLYKTATKDAQYPMDYAIRFLIDKEHVSYWIHARDLPGRPASHGCVGVFDEAMQKRVYGVPGQPLLDDARKLYEWAVGPEELAADDGSVRLLTNGPPIEIRGELPRYLPKPPR